MKSILKRSKLINKYRKKYNLHTQIIILPNKQYRVEIIKTADREEDWERRGRMPFGTYKDAEKDAVRTLKEIINEEK